MPRLHLHAVGRASLVFQTLEPRFDSRPVGGYPLTTNTQTTNLSTSLVPFQIKGPYSLDNKNTREPPHGDPWKSDLHKTGNSDTESR